MTRGISLLEDIFLVSFFVRENKEKIYRLLGNRLKIIRSFFIKIRKRIDMQDF
jgi:hypothetical protein